MRVVLLNQGNGNSTSVLAQWNIPSNNYIITDRQFRAAVRRMAGNWQDPSTDTIVGSAKVLVYDGKKRHTYTIWHAERMNLLARQVKLPSYSSAASAAFELYFRAAGRKCGRAEIRMPEGTVKCMGEAGELHGRMTVVGDRHRITMGGKQITFIVIGDVRDQT